MMKIYRKGIINLRSNMAIMTHEGDIFILFYQALG